MVNIVLGFSVSTIRFWSVVLLMFVSFGVGNAIVVSCLLVIIVQCEW